MVCAYKDKSVADLVYPLSQMILGICELKQDAAFTPIRLKTVALANKLMQQTGQYIPISTILLQLLETRDLREKKKQNEPRCMNKWEFSLRVRTKLLATKQFQSTLQEEIFYYILEYLAINGRSIAFPELAFPITKSLKSFIRDHTGGFTNFQRKNMQRLVQKIQENSEFITSARSKLNISPAEIHSKNIAFLGQDAQVPIVTFFEAEKKLHDTAISDRLQAVIGADIQADSDLDESDDEGAASKKKVAEKKEQKAAETPKKKEQKAAEPRNKKQEGKNKKRKRADDDEEDEVAISGGVKKEEQKKNQNSEKPKKKKQKVKKSAIPKQDVVKPLEEDDI